MATPHAAANSVRRIRSWQRLRRYERNHKRWNCDRRKAIGGHLFRQRAISGAITPYNVRRVAPNCRQHLTPITIEFLGWVLTAWKLGNEKRALVGTHVHIAEIIGCSKTSVERAVERLRELKLVEVRYHYREFLCPETGRKKHTQLCNSYVPSKRLLAHLSARSPRVLISDDPTEELTFKTFPEHAGAREARSRLRSSQATPGFSSFEGGAEQVLSRLESESVMERVERRRQLERLYVRQRAAQDAQLVAAGATPTPSGKFTLDLEPEDERRMRLLTEGATE